MNSVNIYEDQDELAQAAAKVTINELRSAIEANGQAVWVLAGGSTPLVAYRVIASEYSGALDWSKVTFVMGDERITNDTSLINWLAINEVLSAIPAQRLAPKTDLSAEESAADYEAQLTSLPQSSEGIPRLDVLWLGLGEDGHTLSLFPKHPSLSPTSRLVIPVHDSPKPPADRISLSLRALQGTTNAMVLTSGAGKQQAVTAAHHGSGLPITIACSIIETYDGKVSWFVDKNAAPTD